MVPPVSGLSNLAIGVDEPDYGNYLNWLHRSDATLTFPQTLVLRYTILEPEATRLPKVAEDYSKWFHSRLRTVEARLWPRESFSCGDRFTIADIAVGFALYFAEFLKLSDGFKPNTLAYYERLKARPGFQRATQYDSPSHCQSRCLVKLKKPLKKYTNCKLENKHDRQHSLMLLPIKISQSFLSLGFGFYPTKNRALMGSMHTGLGRSRGWL